MIFIAYSISIYYAATLRTTDSRSHLQSSQHLPISCESKSRPNASHFALATLAATSRFAHLAAHTDILESNIGPTLLMAFGKTSDH